MDTREGEVISALHVYRDAPGAGQSGPNFGQHLPASLPRNLAEIVFLPDGFTGAQQTRFRNKVRAFINWVPTVPWFDVLGQGLGFSLVTVESDQPGIDDYRDGANIERPTYFDTGMGYWWHPDPNLLAAA